MNLNFPLPDGIVKATGTPEKPGKGAVINPSRFYVYPDGHGFLFFKNPTKGEDDLSVPFDSYYDALVYLAQLFYVAQKIAAKQPQGPAGGGPSEGELVAQAHNWSDSNPVIRTEIIPDKNALRAWIDALKSAGDQTATLSRVQQALRVAGE
jgi:hypothetical protein